MAQMQNLVLTDRATPTPKEHTFAPKGKSPDNTVAILAESNGTLIGENRVSLSFRETGDKAKIRLVLSMPVVQTVTVDGVAKPTVLRRAVADLSITYAKDATIQERKDLIGCLQSALDESATFVNDTIVDLNAPY